MFRQNVSVLVAALRTCMRNLRGRKFEPEIAFLKYILKAGDCCFHIGASDARHSYVMAKIIKDGKIYAFEPSGFSYKHLVMMKYLHRLKSVSTYHMAVSDKEDSVCLVTPEKSTGHAGRSFAYITSEGNTDKKRTDIRSEKGNKEFIKSVSVDSFIINKNIKQVDFIRCDTEGSEKLILKGARKTLEEYKPSLLIEIHNDALKSVFSSSADEVTGLLTGLGYKMFRENNHQIQPAVSVDESEAWRDYFFIHPDRYNSLPDGPFRELMRDV